MTVTETEQERLLRAVDGEWRTARSLADFSGTGRRQAGQRLQALVRLGFVESRRPPGKERASMRSDAPPLEYRRFRPGRSR